MRLLALAASLTIVTTAFAAQPDLFKLDAASVGATNGADLTLRAPPPLPRAPSYFEEHDARVERDMLFFQHGYTLEQMRERDSLELPGRTPGTFGSSAAGAGILSAGVIGAAHAPGKMRVLFDERFHLGPAILYGGGMGGGFGGKF